MTRQASNKNTRPQQRMWLRNESSNEQAGIQQEHKATTINVIKKNISNEQAGLQQEHKATTTNVIKKK